MFLECANPKCSAEFDYREGQLIRAPKDLRSDRFEPGAIKHFWLCGKCSGHLFLEYRQGEGVVLSRRPLRHAEPPSAKVAAA